MPGTDSQSPPVNALPSRDWRNAGRNFLQCSVAVAVAAILVNTWGVGGLFVPAVVSGGSMAPGLLGAHCRWKCSACQGDFCCDADSLPPAGRDAICPHCGAACDTEAAAWIPGQRILVDRTAFGWRGPRRWETVVLRSPDEPSKLCIKRIVGLPGEVIDLREGDVLIDGAVAQKEPATLLKLAVAVSEESTAESRWSAERDETWTWKDGVCRHPAGRTGTIDWLVYHHTEPTAAGEKADAPILDGSAVDQSESRRLNPVPDVVLRCELRGAADSRAFLRTRWRGDDFRVTLPLGKGAVRLTHNGNRVRAAHVAGGQHDALPVELAIADRRFTLTVGGKVALAYDFEPTPRADAPEGPGLGIGAAESDISVTKLEVLRDIYYTHDPRGPRQYRLAKDEYFVLGDNSPHSVDSRVWSSQGGVTASLLVGPAWAW